MNLLSGIAGALAVTVTANIARAQQQIEQGLTDAGERGGRRASSGLGRTMLTGAAVAGTAIATVLGAALVKGFGRLNAIDQATAKLKGLGHSADGVKLIMDNALASVKGTAFGLGEAASVAAVMVASGIKPGKDLTRTLKLMADTATIAGTDMTEMNNVFGKIAASGKLTGESMQQLLERGIPVGAMLSKSLGVPLKDVGELVSAGKVDFETFQTAMEGSLGGAALASGKTFSGAMKNVGAALGRLGASLIGPVFQKLPGILDGIIGKLDSLGPIATQVGALIGAGFSVVWPIIERVVNAIMDGLAPALQSSINVITAVVGWMVRWKDVLGPLAAGILAGVVAYKAYIAVTRIGAVVTKALAIAQGLLNAVLALNPIGLIVAAIVAFVAVLVVAWKNSETFRNVVLGAWEAVKAGALALWAVIKGAWEAIVAAVRPVIDWFVSNVGPLLASVWAGVKAGVTGIWSVMQVVWEGIRAVVQAVLDWFVGPLVKGLGVVWTVIKTGVKVLAAVLGAYWTVIRTVASVAWTAISTVIKTVWTVIRTVIETALKVVKGLIDFYVKAWVTAFNVVRNVIAFVVGVFTAVRDRISQWLGAAASVVSSKVSALVTSFGSILRGVVGKTVDIFTSVRDTISRWISTIAGNVRSKVTSIVSAFGSIVGEMVAIGRRIMEGLWNGISGMVGVVRDRVANAVSGIVNKVKGVLKIGSPSRVFMEIGKDMVAGVPIGVAADIGRASGKVARYFEDLVPRGLSADLDVLGRWRPSGAADLGDVMGGAYGASRAREVVQVFIGNEQLDTHLARVQRRADETTASRLIAGGVLSHA